MPPSSRETPSEMGGVWKSRELSCSRQSAGCQVLDSYGLPIRATSTYAARRPGDSLSARTPSTCARISYLEIPSGPTIVSDWKTYPHAGAYVEDEWVQLAAYILGASTMLGVDPSQVEGRAVSIPTGEVRVIEGSQELTAAISARIGTEVRSWHSRSRMSFPPRPAREMCGVCRFLEVCPDGQGVATDRGTTDPGGDAPDRVSPWAASQLRTLRTPAGSASIMVQA